MAEAHLRMNANKSAGRMLEFVLAFRPHSDLLARASTVSARPVYSSGEQTGQNTYKTYSSSLHFFPPCFMTIYNPLGYDRPECLYLHDQAWPNAPYLSISALSRRDFWGFFPS